MRLPMGQCDIPQEQDQPVFFLDLWRSNLAVFGLPMSGKTTLVKTLLIRLQERAGELPEEQVYLIDFGGNIGDYGKLPVVCACFDDTNEENIKRVFRALEGKLVENSKRLGSRTYCKAAEGAPADAPPHLTLIVENLNSFFGDDRYGLYQDKLLRFCRDGLSKGLSVVATINDLKGIGRFLSSFGRKIAFEMPNESYFDIFNTRVSKPMNLPGRGLVNQENGVCEIQCFLPFPQEEDEQPLQQLLARYEGQENPHRMVSFSEDLTWDNIQHYCARDASVLCGENEILLGLDYYEHLPVKADIRESRCMAVYGKRKSDKTNLLTLLLQGIARSHPEACFLYLDDGRNLLEPYYTQGPSLISENERHFSKLKEFSEYLKQNGYVTGDRGRESAGLTPLTVFVLQSKMLFRGTTGDAKNLMRKDLPEMIAEAERMNYLFLFSDVANFVDADAHNYFDAGISLAFVLQEIDELVAEKGERSVFSAMNAKELKAEYARCSEGDGYLYDVQTDRLTKLKFLKAHNGGDTFGD